MSKVGYREVKEIQELVIRAAVVIKKGCVR